MTVIRLDLAYDGTDFHGFARQPSLRTVQGVLESALERVLGRPVDVFGSGRTDAGVHARQQVVHFEQTQGPPADRYPRLMAGKLPRDLMVTAAAVVQPDFHARFSVRRKTYRYTLQMSPLEDIYTRRFAWHVPEPLNFGAMNDAARLLVGEHDFSSFCAASTPTTDKVRTIYGIELSRRAEYLDLYYTGSGFLQYMVRIISGTLVDVGLGSMRATDVAVALSARDRRSAGRTAPAHGLSLWSVEY